jgi:hypothetical protein
LANQIILRVLYAPHKAFKDIVEKPAYLLPIFLLIVFVLAQIGSSYVIGTRSYIEQTLPTGANGDVWTDNATLWQANPGVTITNNYVDYINATPAITGFPDYYGNSSVEFKESNSSLIQMALFDLGNQANCGANGFRNFTFRVNIMAPDAKPESVNLTLYVSDFDFFSYDLTSAFSNSVVNVWNNITVPVGSGNWASIGNPSWENITNLKLDFGWSNSSNIDLLVDGMFFKGKFETQIDLLGATAYLANSTLNGFAPFLFEWLILTGIMYLLIKGLKGDVVWKPLMVAVGYALITIVIQAIIVTAIYATLPHLYYSLQILNYIPGEFQTAYNTLLNQIADVNTASYIIQAAVWVWTVALGAFITRAITGSKQIAEQLSMGKSTTATEAPVTGEAPAFSWMKCLLVSGAGLFLTIIIMGFLGV